MKIKNLKTKHLLIILLIQFLSIPHIIAQTVYYDNDTKLYGVIDKDGKNILKPTFEEMTMFENGLSRFKKNNMWGLINEKGVILLQPKFETEYVFCKLGFNDGLISVNKNGKYGYYSEKGSLVIEHKFDFTEQFCDGIAWVELNGKYCFINKLGKYITDKWFDEVKIVEGNLYGIDEKRVYDENKSYYTQGKPDYYKINKDGSIFIANNQDYLRGYKIYQMAYYCDKLEKPIPNITSFHDEKKRTWGYKNNKNEIIHDAIYYFASNFDDGVAIVMQYNVDGILLINEKFETIKVLDSKFEIIWGTSVQFRNGLIQFKKLISNPKDEIQKWEFILINKKGEIIKKMNSAVISV